MFVGRQAVEGLESAREVVGGHASEGRRGAAKVGEVRAQLIVAVVMEAFDGGFLDGAVHPFDLAVGSGMVRLGKSVLEAVVIADHVEAHLMRKGGVAVNGLRLGELDAAVAAARRPPVRSGSYGSCKARPPAGAPGIPKRSACPPCRSVG